MNKPIVFLDKSTIQVPLRPPAFPHQWVDFSHTRPDQTVARLQDAVIVVTNKVRLHEAELSKLPRVQFIAITATGYDNVDLTWCRKHGIGVANVPGYARDSVPEHVLMMILALRRNLMGFQRSVAEGHWQTSPIAALLDYPVYDLKGATLGLIGYGDLAKSVERLAKAFGMKVLIAGRKFVAPNPGRTAFDDVLRQADVLSVHAPLVPETKDLIGAAELGLMKKGAIVINTARGGIVNEEALAAALKSGHLGGAGVDVLSQEPPRQGNPLLDSSLPNTIVTPHVAWTSQSALQTLAEEVILNIEAFMAGKRRNRVD